MTAVASLEVSPTTSARRVLAARPALAAKGTAELLARFPPRPVAQCWPETSIGRAEVLAMASAKSVGPGGSPSDTVRRLLIGLGFLIDWLDAQPGGTWQERWLASGADAAGTDWRALPAGWLERQCKPTNDSHRYVPASMELLIGLGIVRPSIDWLLTGGKGRLLSCRLLRAADAEGFARLHRTCEQDPAITELSERHIVLRCTLLIAAKGDRIADITVGDVLELLERHNYLDVLRAVRSFYLDLAEWALEDPARWGPWVAPCPVGRHELSARKFVRQRKARIDARTRERLPLLPQLARATDEWRKDAAALLAAGRSALPGEPFAAAGEVRVRSQRIRPRIADNVWAEDPESGKQRLLNREEEHAFWSWAVIEVLRFTGVFSRGPSLQRARYLPSSQVAA